MINYDAELVHHHRALVDELHIRRSDRVLDIGCGAGETTRVAAQAAHHGYVIGIDPSHMAIRSAHELTNDAHIPNATYVRGDAAHAPFPRESFDIAISRFGTMFFNNPHSAFRRIHETLRPDARLVMIVWQLAQHNEWALAIHHAITGNNDAMPSESQLPAFSLGNAKTTTGLLVEAGFVDVRTRAVHAPVFYGTDVDNALEFVSGFANVRAAMDVASPTEGVRMQSRMRDVMAAHHTADGVWFDAQSWVVTARRA